WPVPRAIATHTPAIHARSPHPTADGPAAAPARARRSHHQNGGASQEDTPPGNRRARWVGRRGGGRRRGRLGDEPARRYACAGGLGSVERHLPDPTADHDTAAAAAATWRIRADP